MGQFEMGAQAAVVEQPRADPGAEGDDQLQAVAADHGGPLQVGVVGHLGRLAEPGRQRDLQVEADPGVDQFGARRAARARGADEVWRGQDLSLPDHAGEAERDPVEGGQLGDQRLDDDEQAFGRQRVRRVIAHPYRAPCARLWSSTDALMPVPPTSIARVLSLAGEVRVVGTARRWPTGGALHRAGKLTRSDNPGDSHR